MKQHLGLLLKMKWKYFNLNNIENLHSIKIDEQHSRKLNLSNTIHKIDGDMKHIDNKPKEVVLWGVSDSTTKYINFLKELDINIIQIVDQQNSGMVIDNFKTISDNYYIRNINNLNKIPVVITGIEGEDQFNNILTEIVNYPQTEDLQILHPSFLVDYLNLDFTGKVFIFACNRSGSTLLFTILREIFSKYGKSSLSEKESYFEDLSRNHFQSLMSLLDNIFQNQNIYFTTTGVTSFRGIDYMGCKQNEFFFVNPLRTNRYIFDTIHRSCSLPDKDILLFLKNKGYTIFSTIRNPLDIIVSNAFEVEYMYSKMYCDESLDEVESGYRIAFGETRLKNIEWFEGAAKFVYDYYEGLLQNEKDHIFVKYEDMIGKPVNTISKIASVFNIEIHPSEIEALWKRIAFKPLKQHKSHMFRPGSDKWKLYLTKKHIDILKSLNYEKLLSELGYSIELVSDIDFSMYDNVSYKDLQKLNTTLSIGGHINHIVFDMPICFPRNDLINSAIYNRSLNLKVATNSIDLLDTCNKLFSYKTCLSCLSSLDYIK